MKVSDLKPNEKNPRRIDDWHLDALGKSLKKFGDLGCVVFNRRSQRLISGHQRAKKLSPDANVTIITNYLTPTQTGTVAEGFIEIEGERFNYREVDVDASTEKAMNVAANKQGGEFDIPKLNDWLLELDQENYDMDLLGFSPEELENILVPVDYHGNSDEDEIPEHVEPKTKLGDLYQIGEHRLLCGDSTNIQHVEQLMGGEKAEICFTSPPYADQREYNGGKELSTEHLSKFISTAYGHVNYFAVNLGYSRKEGEVNTYWDDYIKEAKQCGLKLLSWNIWDRSGKGYTIGQATAMFTIDHEWVFVFGSNPKELNLTVENKHSGNIQHGTIRNKDGTLSQSSESVTRTHRQLGTVIRTDVERDRNFDHPAKFPVIFPQSYIESMTNTGESVYEPFCGSGTTLIACEKTNRKCYGMELDPKFCDVIVARWEKFSGKKAELING